MVLIRKIARKVLPPAVRKAPHKLCGHLVDQFYGIETEGWYSLGAGDLAGLALGRRQMYQTCPYSVLWTILRALPGNAGGTFYDLGCGKGRIVTVFANSGRFDRCIGVELVEALAEKARENLERVRTHTSVKIITGDAASIDLRDGTVFFFSNPFGPDTIGQVLRNIGGAKKQLYVICYRLYHKQVYDACPWLKQYRMTGRWGIWSTC